MSALDYAGRSEARATDLKTLPDVARTFFSESAPRVILAGTAIVVVARSFVGSFGLVDLATVGLSVLLIGFIEWVIHVYWLHAPQDSYRMQRMKTGVSHRQHHVDPDSVGFLLLTAPDATGYMVVLLAWHATWPLLFAGVVGAPLLATYLTALATTYFLVGYYEWVHLLIHTSYRPKTSYFKRVASHHRLHHYRNEQYWMGVTSRLGDHTLGTAPAKSDVPLSETARTLS